MKQIIYLGLALVFSLSSCNKENDVLSPSDQAALDGIVESLNKATAQNDSCLASKVSGDSIQLNFHDSLFHHFELRFESFHGNYSHGNNHDDHGHHNGQRDDHNNGMNHNCCDGHHDSQHQEMEQLSQSHQDDIH